jgi:hypothetical protein
MTELSTEDKTTMRALRALADVGLEEHVQADIESRVEARISQEDDHYELAHRGDGRPGRRRLTAIGIAVAASLLTVVLLLDNDPTGVRLNAVAQAKAALNPPQRIVHMIVTTRSISGTAIPPRTMQQTEIWTASSPPRWRSRTRVQPSPPGVRVGYLRNGRLIEAHGVIQSSFATGSLKTYRSQFDELTILTGIPDRAPTADGPGVLNLRGHDPARSLRDQLDHGDVKDTGDAVAAGGRPVRRLVGRTRLNQYETQTLVYDVDPDTFAPVQGSLTIADSRPGRSGRQTFTVDRYERLPDTAANAHLLTIPIGTRPQVSTRPAILPRYLTK